MEGFSNYENDQISIGEMAELFNISTRTLRLYHDMGLLIPQHVNNENGYRYYSRNQFQRLEKILQMKAIGLSLKQIKSMMEKRTLSLYEAVLNERIDELNQRIAEDTEARDLLIKQLNSCAQLRNPPVLDRAFIEFIPKRYAFEMNIEPYSFRQHYQETSPWTQAMESARELFKQNDLPLTLLQQSCCTVTQQNLEKRQYICDRALFLADGPMKTGIPQTIVQSGTYACLYRNYIALDGMSEAIGLDLLLQFIEDNHYQIKGYYLGEVVAKTSIFDYQDNTILVKLQIPVNIGE